MVQNSSSKLWRGIGWWGWVSVCVCVCVCVGFVWLQQKKRMKQEGSCVVRGRQEEQMAWQSMGRGRNPPTLWPTFIDEPVCVCVCVCVCIQHVLDTYAISQYYLEQHHPDYFKFIHKDSDTNTESRSRLPADSEHKLCLCSSNHHIQLAHTERTKSRNKWTFSDSV